MDVTSSGAYQVIFMADKDQGYMFRLALSFLKPISNIHLQIYWFYVWISED